MIHGSGDLSKIFHISYKLIVHKNMELPLTLNLQDMKNLIVLKHEGLQVLVSLFQQQVLLVYLSHIFM